MQENSCTLDLDDLKINGRVKILIQNNSYRENTIILFDKSRGTKPWEQRKGWFVKPAKVDAVFSAGGKEHRCSYADFFKFAMDRGIIVSNFNSPNKEQVSICEKSLIDHSPIKNINIDAIFRIKGDISIAIDLLPRQPFYITFDILHEEAPQFREFTGF